MRSRLQLDVRNLSLGRRHLVNAYEVKVVIGVTAGKTLVINALSVRYYKKSAIHLPLPFYSLWLF